MPLFTPYFSLDSSAFRVGNGGRLRCRMGASGIGIYVMLLSHLRDCRDCRAPLDYDMLAFDLHEDAAAVRRVVEDFGLFDIDRSSGTFTSSVLTTVRGMLSDDASAAGVGTTRTVRQRRVRSSGETYRRAVRRLAEDNALPPAEEEEPAEEENQLAEGDAEPAEVKNEPAEELPTSSENEITPAEGEPQPAELDAPLADEKNATGDFAPTSIAAEAEPAEVKHEAADADAAPAEGETPFAEEEDVPTAMARAHSPRREEKRKEQNKKPHTPIVPFPQSGKGTRASHPAAAVVGAQEGDDASAEGDEEPVVGNPLSVPSASAERDAPPCAAAPTVLGTPAQILDPHPSPSDPHGTTNVPNSQSNTLIASEETTHPNPDAAKADTSVPNGTTSTENKEMSTNHSQPNPLTASEKTTHPNPDAENPNEHDTHPSGKIPNGASSVTNGQTSAEKGQMSTNHSQPNPLTASEAPAHPNPDAANGTTSTANPNERDTHPSGKMPNGKSSAENKETSTNHSQPNPLTASEKTTHPQTDTENGTTSGPNGESSAKNKEMSTNHSQPNPLTASEKTTHPNPDAGNGTTSTANPNERDTHPQAEEATVEPFVPPTANEVRRFAETLHHPEFDAEWFVAYYTERHWRRHNGRPVVSWQTTARYWLDHPLRVARHLLDHRPAANPVSVGVGGPSAVVVPAAGNPTAKPVGTSTYPAAGPTSSPSPGTYPVGTGSLSPRSSASPVGTGAPHVGSLSLPAPTPLQQSRLSDLKGMVLHLFADAPAAAPASASTTPDVPAAEADVPANASTPDWVARNSVRPARVLSPAEAAQVIAQQTLASAESEAVPRVVHDSTADAEEIIDTQASPTNAAEEEIDAQAFSIPDTAKGVDVQALSPADAKESVRACDDSTDEDEEEIGTQAFSIPDAEEGIETQALSPAHAEESVRACDNSTDEDEEEIGTQAFSIPDAEEDALNSHDSTTDNAKGIDAQAFSAVKGRWGGRSPRGPDPPTDDEHDSNAIRHAGNDTDNDFADAENNFTAKPSNFSADRHPPAAVGTARAADPPIFAADECCSLRTLIEKHPYLNPSFHEPHPLLRLHPPSFGGFGHTFRVQSAQPPFGRSFLGRFVDIRPACTVGSRPLRPRLALCRTERGRCRPEHPDRECTTSANAAERSANAGEHTDHEHERGTDGRKRHDSAPERSANAIRPPADEPEHGTDGHKIADFIDVDPVRGHKIDRNEPEHPANAAERSANAVSTPADEHEHDAQRAKNADFIDAEPVRGHRIERNASEHLDRGCKRHDSAPEHPANAVSTPADECPDPAYDLDAGQRVLRSAAHRRAVRTEREACCGALRHLAHCCVAF